MTSNNTQYKAKVESSLRENFEVRKDLRQGDPVSTVLFRFVLAHVNQKM